MIQYPEMQVFLPLRPHSLNKEYFTYELIDIFTEIRIMEMITVDIIKKFLSDNVIEIKSTHNRLSVPVINRIYKKMRLGIDFSGIKVENGLICDGHHRYLASLIANYDIDRIPYRATSATMVIDWNDVVFDHEDWDTEAKIRMLNEQDAQYNKIAIEKLNQLLK